MSHYSNTSFEGLNRGVAVILGRSVLGGTFVVIDIEILVEVVFDCEKFTTSLIEVMKMFGESGRINI